MQLPLVEKKEGKTDDERKKKTRREDDLIENLFAAAASQMLALHLSRKSCLHICQSHQKKQEKIN